MLYSPCVSEDAGVAQLVEHNLAKVGVTGSSPATRSIFPPIKLKVKSSGNCGDQLLAFNFFCFQGGIITGVLIGPGPLHSGTDYGGVAKWLRQRSAKPSFSGSNPLAASIFLFVISLFIHDTPRILTFSVPLW